MKINKAELQTALEKVKPGLASRELIEQSTSFAFMGDRVVTYNDEISISHPVAGVDINGAVKAQALYDFLNKVKKDEIEFTVEENQIIIQAGRSKAGLVFESEIKLPIDEEVGEGHKWTKLSPEFIEALKFCHPCCAKDMSRPVLTCVYVNGKEITASDSYQIVLYTLSKKIPVDSFLIPASSVRELVKYDVKEIAVGENDWIHFKTKDGTVFSARTMMGDFPNVKPHLEIKEGIDFEFPKNIQEILQRADVFSNKEDLAGRVPVVTVEIKDKKLTVSTQNSYGWFKETTKTKHDGSHIKFMAGIDFLNAILDKFKSCVISDDKIGLSGDAWQMVVAMSTPEE